MPGRMIIEAAAVLLILGSTSMAHAQSWILPTEKQQQIDAVFTFVERDAPGCAMGVIERGKLVYGRGYGVANMDWEIPITTSTVFDLGSVSKQFTAAAVLLLHIEGKLNIDDEVRKCVTELPEYNQPITIRHLVNHTSGIRDYLTLMTLAGMDFDNVFTEFDGIELIARQRGLNFEVGSEYLYSNSGYLLLANIVRRATGKSIREYLQERYFVPLGMNSSSIWDDNTEILKERATGYGHQGNGWQIDHAWNFQMGGDGQVISSIDDLVKWDALFYDPVVGGQALLEQLHTQGILSNGEQIEYAGGLVIDEYRDLKRVSHGGAWAGFRASMARFPDRQTSICILCNRSDATPGTLMERIADIVLFDGSTEARDERPSEPVQLEPEQLAKWEGIYRQEDPIAVRVFVEGDRLFGIAQGQQFPLIPYSAREFEVAGTGVRLAFDDEGDLPRITVIGSGTEYRLTTSYSASAEELVNVVGSYYSPELEATWTFSMNDQNQLTLKRPNSDKTEALFLSESEIDAAGIGIRLERNELGVTGLRVFAGRVRNIQYEKIAD